MAYWLEQHRAHLPGAPDRLIRRVGLRCFHGFPEFHYSWTSVMDELASEYRLVAPDQRGYNLSQ